MHPFPNIFTSNYLLRLFSLYCFLPVSFSNSLSPPAPSIFLYFSLPNLVLFLYHFSFFCSHITIIHHSFSRVTIFPFLHEHSKEPIRPLSSIISPFKKSFSEHSLFASRFVLPTLHNLFSPVSLYVSTVSVPKFDLP